MAEGDQTTVTASTDAGAAGVGAGVGVGVGAGAGADADAGGGPVTAAQEPSSQDVPLSPLEAELEMVTMERDNYHRRLETVEAEIAALTAASPNADTINKLQQDNDHLRKTLKKATDMLREKMTFCNVQEKKNQALTQQVTTLKEVLQVTRDLLNIRNMEVEQLQKNVDSMEARINDNRRRQTAMIKQMEQATKINGELRNEYETQLRIFQSLKERYEEKVTALTTVAKLRERHNSEGSEKFEDAPDTADGIEKADTAEASNSSETATAPQTTNTEQILNVSETSTTEMASPEENATELATPQTSNAPETSAQEISASEVPASETTNSSEISAQDTTNISEVYAPKTTNTSEVPSSETNSASETAKEV